ncbi:MAG: ABC transporter permease [Niastella sp.]|nr:ABC transporter permease [Niastella sp.]
MKYSQFRAMLAITKASLRSILRSPSAVIFGFAFPFIFILVFGFIGNGGGRSSFKIIIQPGSDTMNPIYTALKNNPSIRFLKYDTPQELTDAKQKGSLAGTVGIYKNNDSTGAPYKLTLSSTTSSNDKWPALKNLLDNIINGISNKMYSSRPVVASFHFDETKDIETIREYKTIDFILPGQLGFSLLSAGVFGVAFMFFSLRTTQVLKRFFATPISRTYIVLGEALSRVIFQMITAVVIILAGYFFFGFTLVHGFQTFMALMFLSFLGLLVFMGFGFIVSGLAKNESTIPPFANIITLPQFLLGGTFFSIDVFPGWLQPIAKLMPLTHLNEAMRGVAFEGLSLWSCRNEIGILMLWGIVTYIIAIKVFKWE